MCNKQRILIVHNYYQVPGGEDSVVANEKKMLEDHGHKVFLYTRHNDEIKKMGVIEKILFPFQSIYSFKTKREIRSIIKKYSIDIVHVHNTLPLISPSVYSAAKSEGVRVIQTIHNFRLLCPAATFVRNDTICEDCIDKGLLSAIKGRCYRNSFAQTFISVAILKFNRIIGSYKKVDKYITLSDFNKDKLSKVIDKNKIVVKPNFVEMNECIKKEVNQRRYYLFLGRIDKLKGINKLVESWKNVDGEELVIVGTGPEEEHLKKYIEDNHIDNVHFLGYKKKEEAMNILSYAKALIVPSQWYEGLPMTIIEAFSLAVPVICSDIGNIKELGKDSLGVLDYKDNSKWHNLINNISSEDLVCASYKANNMYEKKYSIENNYRKLLDIYKD